MFKIGDKVSFAETELGQVSLEMGKPTTGVITKIAAPEELIYPFGQYLVWTEIDTRFWFREEELHRLES